MKMVICIYLSIILFKLFLLLTTGLLTVWMCLKEKNAYAPLAQVTVIEAEGSPPLWGQLLQRKLLGKFEISLLRTTGFMNRDCSKGRPPLLIQPLPQLPTHFVAAYLPLTPLLPNFCRHPDFQDWVQSQIWPTGHRLLTHTSGNIYLLSENFILCISFRNTVFLNVSIPFCSKWKVDILRGHWYHRILVLLFNLEGEFLPSFP